MAKKEKVVKNKKSIVIFITIVLLITIGIIVMLWWQGKKLDTDSELVTELYTYIGNNDLQVCDGLVTYGEEKVGFDDIDNNLRICSAYSLLELDEGSTIKVDTTKKDNTCSIGNNIVFASDNYEDDICTITKISSDLVNEQYKKMYGKDIENYEQFQYNDTTVCYYEDGYYYCGLSESYSLVVGGEPHTYRSIKKATLKNDELIIYDYFLRITNNECYMSYMGENINKDCSNVYSDNQDIDYRFLRKYGQLYKHTFSKMNDSYYWVSSEPY